MAKIIRRKFKCRVTFYINIGNIRLFSGRFQSDNY